MDTSYDLTAYSYSLPKELIAETSVKPHHNAKLMVINKETGMIEAESTFWNLDQFLGNDRVLFFNNSKVLPARIPLRNRMIRRADGSIGHITEGEILFCKKLDTDRFECLVRPGAKFRNNTKILFPEWEIEILDMSDTGRIMTTHGTTIETIMEQYGELPLPPYITYSKEKEKDYQTVFAKKEGSVAAPTASLHFTTELLEKLSLQKEYVTLHVWLWTFKWIQTPDIRSYQIHGEMVEIELSIFETIPSILAQEKKIVAVGTTSCRTLESLPHLWKTLSPDETSKFSPEAQQFWNERAKNANTWYIKDVHMEQNKCFFETSIYIFPGIPFRIVDELITNFHLPESSLLVLVSAFLGKKQVSDIYTYAIKEQYRFFSFGDGMYIRTKS